MTGKNGAGRTSYARNDELVLDFEAAFEAAFA
jgi:hypothetical protein